MVAATGLVPLEAPLPRPPLYDLLAAASLVEPARSTWLRGSNTGGDVPGPASTHDSCSSGTDRQKVGAGVIPTQMAGAFTVYLPGFCTAQSIGPDPTFWTDRLELVFQAFEGAAVERVLVSGDGHGTLGHYLGDVNMEVLGSGSQAPLRAFELLEAEIAATGGSGMLHADPQVAAAWDALNLTENARGVKRSRTTGHPIAVGAGYLGAVPEGQAGLGTDEAWAFASGPVEVLRTSDITLTPARYADAIDRSMNDVLFLAERPYLINWIARQDVNDDDHAQAGVLVDLS